MAALVIVPALYFAGYLPGRSHPRSSASTSPCSSAPVQVDGALSGNLDAATNRSLLTLGTGFGNRTAQCATIALAGPAEGSGLGALENGSAAFAVSPVLPTASELVQAPAAVTYLPVSVDAVAIVFHPGIALPLHLDAAALAGIFEGSIRSWGDPSLVALNAGLNGSSAAVLPAYPAGSSAPTESLTAYLSAENSTWNRTVGTEFVPQLFAGDPMPSASALLSYVAATPGAVGYVAVSELGAAPVGLAEIADRAGGFVGPNGTGIGLGASAAATAVLDAWRTTGAGASPQPELDPAESNSTGCYPLTTFLYVVLYHELADALGGRLSASGAAWLVSFLVWLADDGQSEFAANGLAPMPGPVAAVSLSVLEGITYHGESVLTADLGSNESGGEGGNETGAS